MKKYVVLILAFGLQSMACPSLSGTYMCEEEGDEFKQVVTQTITNGVTTYTVTSDENQDSVIADGKERMVDGSAVVATCDGDSTLNLLTKGSDQGYDFHVNMNISADASALYSSGTFEVLMNGQVVQKENFNQACRRL